MKYLIELSGPDAEQALAELRSNIQYDQLDVVLNVAEQDKHKELPELRDPTLCPECSQKDHDQCPLAPGCDCCAQTMAQAGKGA